MTTEKIIILIFCFLVAAVFSALSFGGGNLEQIIQIAQELAGFLG